ncbi:glycosyltransferase family 2 protein [bacterium]|nr:glycosyltransferase family 2 protein [bacterium]
MNVPSVSFVIPHKGREVFLQQTLQSIVALEGQQNKSVFVVTQNEQLSSETLTFSEQLDLRVLYAEPSMTIAALRNLGVKESSAEYLAFLDADVALSPNWLNAMLGILQDDSSVALVSAMQQSGQNAPDLEVIRTTLSNAVVDADVGFLPGRNLLLARETFEAVGGFPEHLVTCEDYYFTDKVGEMGRLWYSSAATYVHLGEDRVYADMFQKEIWRGQSNLQSLKGRRVKVSEWPSFLIPPWITVMSLLTPVFLLSGNASLAVLTVAAALAPFTAYVTRLYFLAAGRVTLPHILRFYSYYFPARAWGTVIGVFRSLGHDLHDR